MTPAARRRRYDDDPPRVVDMVENFFQFAAQCNLHRGPSEELSAELERQYRSTVPHATAADIAGARVRIRNILGLPI